MRILNFVALAILVISLSSCDDNITRSSGEDRDYEILVSYGTDDPDPGYYTYVISSKYDSILEKIPADPDYEYLTFSQDGEILYHSCIDTDHTWATRWPDGDTIAIQAGISGEYIELIEDNNWIILREYSSIIVLDASTLEIVVQLDGGKFSNTFSPDRSKILFHDGSPAGLYYYDLTESPPSLHEKDLYDENNNSLASEKFCTRSDCDSIFAIVETSQNDYRLAIIEPDNLEVIKTIDIPYHAGYWQGDMILHPDKKRLYFCNRGNYITYDDSGIDPGIIYEYDLIEDKLTVLMDEEIFGGSVTCYDLEFSPDYNYLYAGVWSSLVRINIKGKKPNHEIMADVCCPVDIAINPELRED